MLLWRLRLALPRLLPVVAAIVVIVVALGLRSSCLLYTSPSPRDS